jgi:NifU-like protein involved in Fe-S cluster formation
LTPFLSPFERTLLARVRNHECWGTLPVPPASQGRTASDFCDEIDVFVNAADGSIQDVRVCGDACLIARASATVMASLAQGASLATVEELCTLVDRYFTAPVPADARQELVHALRAAGLGPLMSFRYYRARTECVLTPWNALRSALASAGRPQAWAPA